MTHTLHRQGNIESLKEDYIVLVLGTDIPFGAYRMRMRRKFPGIYEIAKKALLDLGILNMLRTIKRMRPRRLCQGPVFSNKKELAAYLKELKEKATGKSVVVSGLFEEVNDCLKEINLTPHTVQFSLGIFGKKELLARDEILEITTMCGHHMISPRLVEKLAGDIKNAKISSEQAIRVMSRQCVCSVCNEPRARKLIEALAK